MNNIGCMDRIGIVVTIVERGQGDRAAQFYKKEHGSIVFQYIFRASGTAGSEILDCLGLEETEKDVVISLLPSVETGGLLRSAKERMDMGRPGGGIAFTLGLSALSRCVCSYFQEEHAVREEEHIMEKEAEYELILAIVNYGFADKAMDAAKEKGAAGGTVMETRLAGSDDAARFLGITIRKEKEIVAIVTTREAKGDIMQAINHAAGMKTEGKGILMSLPVYDLIGIRDMGL